MDDNVSLESLRHMDNTDKYICVENVGNKNTLK